MVPPKTVPSNILSATSKPVYSPPVRAVAPTETPSCAPSVTPSKATDLPILLPISLAASTLPSLPSALINCLPVMVRSSSFGITLPAPNLSSNPMMVPAPMATASS